MARAKRPGRKIAAPTKPASTSEPAGWPEEREREFLEERTARLVPDRERQPDPPSEEPPAAADCPNPAARRRQLLQESRKRRR